MGRKKNTSLKVKGLFIFPLLLRSKNDFKAIIFRVTDKAEISFDVECYDDSQPERIRIKSKPEFWDNGKIHGGYSEATVDRLNICLTNLQSKIVAYINNNDFISKPLLMAFLYGGDFAQTSKKRRTQYITIPIEYQGNAVDSFELTSKEVKELIAPHFTKVTFTNSDGQPKTIEGIFDDETGESMIQSDDDLNEMVTTLKHDKYRHEDFRKLKLERQNRTTEEKYKLGEYNKNDICEVFALTYYDPTITNDYYSKIVIRLFEYKERTKVSTHVKDFNLEWIKAYFKWFEENGQYHINTSAFDPLKYNKEIFFKDKPRKPYKGKSVEK
jgi:hypothetical protein